MHSFSKTRQALLCIISTYVVAFAVDIGTLDKQQQLLLASRMPPIGKSVNGATIAGEATGVDNSIDPDQYYIGGGDVFSIELVGLPSVQYKATVNQQGDLFFPELGSISLGRTTLTNARELIAAFVQNKLRRAGQAYVTLTDAKKVTVSVNGAVSFPGTYVMSGVFRVIDALRTANGETMPSFNEANVREIRIQNHDTTYLVDLYEYILKNDLSSNPYLFPGDNITVSYSTRRVFLNVPLRSPVSGWVPIKSGETAGELLSLFAFDPSIDTSALILQTGSTQRTNQTIPWAEAQSLPLNDRDVITIPTKKDYSKVFMVNVTGEVLCPGAFPATRENTTVDEIVALACGVTSQANSDRAFIVRYGKVSTSGANDLAHSSAIDTRDIIAVRPEMTAALSKMAITKDFAIITVKSRGGTFKILPDDNVVIPKKEYFVYVSGDVKSPGAYEYVSGKGYKFYIARAGGYTSRADRSNLCAIGYYNGATMVKDINDFEEGDVLVVPDKVQGKVLTAFVLPVLSAIVSALSLGLGLYSTLGK